MTDQEVYERLNPQIEEVEIGIRQLRKIKIYPLSLADQIKLTGLISGVIKNFSKARELTNAEFLASLKTVLHENLGTILSIITDDGEKLLTEVTNVQALVIGEIVYKNNFGILEKKNRKSSETVVGGEVISLGRVITGILRFYPQYSLEHFFRRSWREGGLTLGQILLFYEHAYDDRADIVKIVASFLGTDLSKDKPNKKKSNKNTFIFEGPEAYKNLTDEEKKQRTKEMMASHKRWAKSSALKDK